VELPVRTVVIVANEPDAAIIGAWLAELGGARVRAADASDNTLQRIARERADVLVLDAGLERGDALAFVSALRKATDATQLVLIADDGGRVTNALDAAPYRADRFLRRPLARAALVFAVRSCLQLGRADVVGAVLPRGGGAAGTAAAFAALHDLGPAPAPIPAEVSSGVAIHTLAARIEEATHDAIEAFLLDQLEEVLSLPPVADTETEAEPAAVAEAEAASEAASAADSDPGSVAASVAVAPVPRDPTLVISAARPPPGAKDEPRTGTFVSAVRRHMSAVEARLFGGSADDGAPAVDDSTPPDIDLDSIGVTTINPFRAPAPEPSVVAPVAPRSDGSGRATSVRVEPAPARFEPAASLPGELADEDVARLLGRLAREQFTGRVVFRRGEAQKTVTFDEGRPVFAASNLAHDRMGELLVREGKISRDQIVRARDVLTQSGRRMGEILVDLGFLKRRELLPSVRRHIEDVLYSLFAWDSGAFVAVPGSSAGSVREEKIRLAAHPTAIIVEGIRRKLGLERLRALVGLPATVLVPAKREDFTEALADADLAPEERQTVELFDGRRSLADVVAASAESETTVYQLAHALVALGLTRPERAREGTDAGRVTGVSAPGSWITGATDIAIDRERVLAKHAHVREADYFDVLGVRRDATAFEIRRAFETARRDYAPESFAADVQRELATELAEIAQVLAEAQRVLRSDEIRGAYLRNLKE
jgi:CheY-like chemotaxis protein